LLYDCVIKFAKEEKHIKIIHKWYVDNQITDLSGEAIEGLPEFSNKHLHFMLRQIYQSFEIPLEEKQKLLESLEQKDSTDWMEKSKAYCAVAHPTIDTKIEGWN